jgi:uncharacterized membrane protein YhaH (DUF805 family)
MTEDAVMSLLAIILVILVVVVWAITIADIIRRHYPTGTTIGWIALVVILPLVGSIVWWATRKPEPGEAEEQYLAQASRRHDAASRPFDSTGTGL